jgi:hypothetical protein
MALRCAPSGAVRDDQRRDGADNTRKPERRRRGSGRTPSAVPMFFFIGVSSNCLP